MLNKWATADLGKFAAVGCRIWQTGWGNLKGFFTENSCPYWSVCYWRHWTTSSFYV